MVWHGEACGEEQDLAEESVSTFLIVRGLKRGGFLFGFDNSDTRQNNPKVGTLHFARWLTCAESRY